MTRSKEASKDLAEVMLTLHVEHELSAFEEDAFLEWFDELSPELFTWFEEICLRDLITPALVKSVIARNVVENEIPGAVAEIAGEAATTLFNSRAHKNTRLSDFVSMAQYQEFVHKLLELREQRKNSLNHLVDLPIYKELISGVLYQAIVRYIYEDNSVTKKVPGVSSMLKFGKNMVNKAMPKLEDAVEENIRNYIAGSLGFLVNESKAFLENSLSDEELEASAMELWDLIENKTMGDFQQGMDSIDLSEFVVLGYEFWRGFRKTPYFQQCYECIVDYLFEKYGTQSIAALLEELAITPEKVRVEVHQFAPMVLATLKESGQLESIIRRRLESFYYSDKLARVLKNHGPLK